jgi:DeoR family transcriptional regulator, fructose operon transcriptional repressor
VNGEARTSELVRALKQDGRVEVVRAAQALGVAEMTIRRDLDLLVRRGVARRVRGGAVSLLLRGEELPYAMRELEAVGAKRRIGAAVAAQLKDGEAVALDSGTTALEIARALGDRRLTVLATALRTALELSQRPSIRLLQPGGEVRAGELAAVGQLAISAISSLRFDTAVICACGLAGGTVTAHDLEDAAVKQAMMASAARVIVAADSSKLGHSAMAVVSPLEQADLLVTDSEASDGTLDELERSGVPVLRV